MGDILNLILVFGGVFLFLRFVLPRLGIQG